MQIVAGANNNSATKAVRAMRRSMGSALARGSGAFEDTRLITAEVSGLSFTTVYVPNGKTLEHEDFPRKLAWIDALIAQGVLEETLLEGVTS